MQQDGTVTKAEKKKSLLLPQISVGTGIGVPFAIAHFLAHFPDPRLLFLGGVLTFGAVTATPLLAPQVEPVVESVLQTWGFLDAPTPPTQQPPHQEKKEEEKKALLSSPPLASSPSSSPVQQEPLQTFLYQPQLASPPSSPFVRGKWTRAVQEEGGEEEQQEEKESLLDMLDLTLEEGPTPFTQESEKLFVFSDLLETGWRPTWNEIFIGRTLEGKNLFVPITKLNHVALAGRTGGGKGSILRVLMAQLCYLGAQVVFFNHHYQDWVCAQDGPKYDEDWTPFRGNHPHTKRPYLELDPLGHSTIPKIEQALHRLESRLLDYRIEESRKGGKRWRPYFIVIDEWPTIQKRTQGLPAILARFLRESRKYGIYVILSSQDFLVNTIGVEGGSVRECFYTCYYTGGDPVALRTLMKGTKDTFREQGLGKGKVGLRSIVATEDRAVQALMPFGDNQAMYTLLGPSTYQEEPPQEEQASLLVQGSTQEGLSAPPVFRSTPSSQGSVQRRMVRTEALPGGAALFRLSPQTSVQHKLGKVLALLKSDPAMTLAELGQRTGYVPAECRRLYQKLEEAGLLQQEEQREQALLPILPKKGPSADDIPLAQAVRDWNEGANSVKKLMEKYEGMKYNQARLLRARILQQGVERQEEDEESDPLSE